MEVRRAGRIVDNLAGELDCYAGDVDLRRRPPAVVSFDVADGADQSRGLVNDGDQMADRPVLFTRTERTADHALGSVQRHQAPDHARLDLPPVGRELGFGPGVTRLRSLAVGRRRRSCAETFESVAKKSAVGAKRMHV